ncbi:hypothetical protein Tco_1153822 [Tanacetum coccineum]
MVATSTTEAEYVATTNLLKRFNAGSFKELGLKHVKRGRDTKIPQSSSPPIKVGDEAVHKELGDSMERAATTASILEAEQDSGSGPRISSGRKKSRGSNSGDGDNTRDGGKTVSGAIGARGDGIGDSLLVASYACMTFINGSSWKGEMASEAKRYLVKSSEEAEEVFPDEAGK